MDINFQSLKEYTRKESFFAPPPEIRNIRLIINEIDKLIDIEDIKITYPKYLFLDDIDVEIYLIDSRCNIIKYVCLDDQITSSVYFYKDVYNVINKADIKNDTRSLEIKFSNGDLIEFNSNKDTNNYYQEHYSILISEIFKMYSTGRI